MKAKCEKSADSAKCLEKLTAMEKQHDACVADPASCPEKKQKKDYKGKKQTKGDKSEFLRGKAKGALEGLTDEERKAVQAKIQAKIDAVEDADKKDKLQKAFTELVAL